MGMRWQRKPGDAFSDMADDYRRSVEIGVLKIVQRNRIEMSNYMKSNAPWTDRTGNARQALHTALEYKPGVSIVIEFGHGHGIEYGIYLEFKNAGRYAIVNPTGDVFAPRIWSQIQGMLRT